MTFTMKRSSAHLSGMERRCRRSDVQLLVHSLEVTGQDMVTQIKASVASLEGIALEDQVLMACPWG